jgi:sialic acid synthase SpsE
MLEMLAVPGFKIGSGEITNVPLLRHIARKGKPIILSTGMATLADVELAVRTIEGEGQTSIVLLHCVTNYPAVPADMNLLAMATLHSAFGYPVGLSDHTMGIAVSIAAVALGSCVIEKHLTLDRRLDGPDQAASLEPAEFAALVEAVKQVEAAMGTGRKAPTDAERANAQVARRSLVAAVDLDEGTTITESMLAAKRPGDGLSPAMMPAVVGRRLRRALAADEPLRFDDLQ